MVGQKYIIIYKQYIPQLSPNGYFPWYKWKKRDKNHLESNYQVLLMEKKQASNRLALLKKSWDQRANMGNLLLLISTGEPEFLPPVSTATSATSGWCIRISAVGGDKRQDQRCGGKSKAALVFFWWRRLSGIETILDGFMGI